ncbi:cytochrome c, partial [Candidatus Saccharibacteria bacterium]|nr:cytochrome c [Candidatus Saccharibacteria bacterium]
EKRIKLMKANSSANKAIKKSFAKGEYAAVEGKAKVVVQNMEKLADLFPKGSTSDKSRAKTEIWDKWDDFKKKLTSAKEAAQTLADAAATKDQPKTGEAFKAFGKVCGSCHKPYRAPRK